MASKNNKMIHEVFGRKPISSFDPDNSWPLARELIGVEIEIEDCRGATPLSYWSTHSDGSLRNGIEYVLAGPTGGRQLTEAIDQFFGAGLRYSTGPRTSIHIHLNASDNMTIDQFRNMFTIMYLIEPAVFRWADENRKWCGYCSPLTDLSPYRIINILNDDPRDASRFVHAVQGDGNSDRYYGFNVAAYARHGTVEFRYFPCTTDRQKVFEWIKFCMYVKKTAKAFGSPEDILGALSNESALTAFINEYFGEVASHIGRNLDYDDCLGRVKDMGALINVAPGSLRSQDTYYRSVRSKGMSRFLQKNFPSAVVEPAVKTSVPTASEMLSSYVARSTGVPTAPVTDEQETTMRSTMERYRDEYRRLGGISPSNAVRAQREIALTNYYAAQAALASYRRNRRNAAGI